MQVQLIVSSPLTRCLETAAGVFGVHPPDSNSVTGNGAGTASGGTEPNGATSALSNGVWMNSIEDEDGKCTKHSSIGLPSIPVVAHEACRETLGVRSFSNFTAQGATSCLLLVGPESIFTAICTTGHSL